MTQTLAKSALLLFATSALVVWGPEASAATHHHRHHVAAKSASRHHRGKAHAKAAAPTTYKVRSGDTLYSIADKLGTSVEALKKTNHLKGSALRVGQVLKIPGAAKAAEAQEAPAAKTERRGREEVEAPTTYKVRRHDTLGKIAAKLGVSVAELKRANHLRHNTVKAGQVLKVPGAASEEEAAPSRSRESRRAPEEEAAPPTRVSRADIGKVVEAEGAPRTHRVRRGDTIAKVARELGVSESELKRMNHIRGSHLRRGQVLRGERTTYKAYVVGPEDTIYTISRRFDVSVARLRAENGLGSRGSIHTGQKLRLPSGYHDLGPAAGEFHPTYAPPIRTTPATPSPVPPSRGYVPPTTVPGAPAAAPTAAPPPSDAQISAMGRGRFVWPLTGAIVSDFGPKTEGQRNDGINIQATTGDPVRAAAAGDVVYAGDQVPGFGNLVLIKHTDGWVTAYGHLSRIEVKMQQKVSQGQEIGLAGATGGVSTPQLHFEVRYAPSPMERARPIDPKLVLPAQ